MKSFLKREKKPEPWIIEPIGNAIECGSGENTTYFENSELEGDKCLSAFDLFNELSQSSFTLNEYQYNGIKILRNERGFLVFKSKKDRSFFSDETLQSETAIDFLECILKEQDEKTNNAGPHLISEDADTDKYCRVHVVRCPDCELEYTSEDSPKGEADVVGPGIGNRSFFDECGERGEARTDDQSGREEREERVEEGGAFVVES